MVQAARRPGAPAVFTEGRSVSYGELANQSRHIAAALRARDIAHGSLIGVCLARTPGLAPCLLGILSAGHAYLPLEARHLTERSGRILRDAGTSSLIVDRPDRLGNVLAHDTQININEVLASAGAVPTDEANTGPWADSDSLAYVIYTSGSTGEPKGVEITHGGVTNTITAVNRLSGMGPGDRVLNVSPLGFDLSVYDLFGAWAAGAAVVLPKDTPYPEPNEWLRSLKDGKVTIWNSAPALLDMLLDTVERGGRDAAECLESLRVVMLSGDRISLPLLRRITQMRPDIRVLAMGGATEASIWSVHSWVEDLPADSPFVPYGAALPNQSTVVLDSSRSEVAVGELGELYIGGAGLARGYRNRPDLTAAAFVADPHRPGTRLYATGDRVRRLARGNLEFIGRKDAQVKIRGFRVEPLEVERALLRLDEIRQACVVCVPTAFGPSLHAHVVPHESASHVSASVLRERLLELLPVYMVPEKFRILDDLPVTQNGKVDVQRLRDPGAPPGPSTGASLPTVDTTTVQHITALWCEVLSLGHIRADEHFMDVGGNSLLAFQIVTRLSETMPIDIQIRDIFENPTIAALSATIDERLAAS